MDTNSHTPDKTDEAFRSRTPFGGWVRFDPDGALRGWATNREVREDRLTVEIVIDGETIATILADRFDPKLIELGEGNGFYAFECLIPPRYRDGEAHGFSAQVHERFALRAKTTSFVVDPSAVAPAIADITQQPFAVAGRMLGRLLKDARPLELWRGMKRLDVAVDTNWLWQHKELRFTAHFPNLPMGRPEDPPLVLAYPGMMEAGFGATLVSVPTLAAEVDTVGRLHLKLEHTPLATRDVEVRVYRGDGEPTPYTRVQMTGREAVIEPLPIEATSNKLRLSVVVNGVERPWNGKAPNRRPDSLTRNSNFLREDMNGPAAWSGRFEGLERLPMGVHAAVECRPLSFSFDGDGTEALLLSQDLLSAPEPSRPIDAMVLGRASQPIALKVRLVGDGSCISEGALPIVGEDWTVVRAALISSPVQKGMSLQLVADARAGATVQIAAFRLGADDFSRPPALTLNDALLLLNNVYVRGRKLPETNLPKVHVDGQVAGLEPRDVWSASDVLQDAASDFISCHPLGDLGYARLVGAGDAAALRVNGEVLHVQAPSSPTEAWRLIADQKDAFHALSREHEFEQQLLAALEQTGLRAEGAPPTLVVESTRAQGGLVFVRASAPGSPQRLWLVNDADLRRWPFFGALQLGTPKSPEARVEQPTSYFAVAASPTSSLSVLSRRNGSWSRHARVGGQGAPHEQPRT